MALAFYSVLRRNLSSTGRYFEAKDGKDCPIITHIAAGEELTGWYENPEPWQDTFLAFTQQAMYAVKAGNVARIELADVMGFERPAKSLDVMGVGVKTRDGVRFLRVAGTHKAQGRHAEALERIGGGDKLFSNAWAFVQVIHILAGVNAERARREVTGG
jgi:hypothetical protein